MSIFERLALRSFGVIITFLLLIINDYKPNDAQISQAKYLAKDLSWYMDQNCSVQEEYIRQH